MSSTLNVQVFNLLDMNTLADRLKAALAKKGMKQIQLATAVGLTRGAVSLWLNGTTKELTGENLVKAANALGVSPEWLGTGKGPQSPTKSEEISLEENPDYPAIRRVRLKISAGISGFSIEPLNDDHAPIVFSKGWFERNRYNPDDLVAIKVSGASMEPGLFDGDWVVVNTGDATPRDGVVFALNHDGNVVVKRLFKVSGEWMAASDNPDKRIYRDRELNGDTFIIGRVVHKQSERI